MKIISFVFFYHVSLFCIFHTSCAFGSEPLISEEQVEHNTSCFASEERLQELKRKLWSGEYSFVIDNAVSPEDFQAGADEFSYLAAIASGHSFQDYFTKNKLNGRRPTEEEEIVLKRLSKQSTDLYEIAFREAVTDIQKARLISSWWMLKSKAHYYSDSPLFREWMKATSQEIAHGNYEYLSNVIYNLAIGILQWVPQGGEVSTTQEYVKVARCLQEEFLQVCSIGISEDKFYDIVRDLPMFLCNYIPLQNLSNDEAYWSKQFRWHLWNAVVHSDVGEEEREIIDRQVESYCEFIEHEIDTNLQFAELPAVGAYYSDKFRDIYNKLKNNCLIPYFKHPEMPYQSLFRMNFYNPTIEDTKQNLQSEINKINSKEVNDSLQELQRIYAEAIFNVLYIAAVRSDRPLTRCYIPPGFIVRSSSGSFNKHDVFVYTINEIKSTESVK